MQISFSESETKKNLLKAFAGESQARNRYTFAANYCRKEKLHVIEAVFNFTADQERAHALVFYNLLKESSGENIAIEGTYPVDNYDNVYKLLESAKHNEFEEYDVVYKNFAEIAEQEGFVKAASSFKMIAEVEKMHGERFSMLADEVQNNKLFISDVKTKWMCLNCGHIYEGTQVPAVCPVCEHDKGFFIRLELASFSK